MKEKKKLAVSWILTWAGQKRIAYVWSVLLAIGNVIFKILPYFIGTTFSWAKPYSGAIAKRAATDNLP